MSGISRVNKDIAGGLIIGEDQTSVYVNGYAIALDGSAVMPHGDSPHVSATMIAGLHNIYVAGKKIIKEGDYATCGDISTGSSNVFTS